MSSTADSSLTELESSRSSLIFVQLLLLALPILTAPVIFTAGNIGEDFGIDLLILAVIGAEFAALAIFGMRKSKDLGKNIENYSSKIVEEIELQCPNCQRIFPIFIRSPSDDTALSENCTYCGEESSIVLN